MEKLKKIVEVIKLKWLKDTLGTAILIALIIALFLGINIFTQKLDPEDIDLTPEKLYSLTEESKERISSLPDTDKFEIYLFDIDDSTSVANIAKQYEQINENIKVEMIDSNNRLDLVSKYNVESGYGTVVIVNGDKSKTFTSYDFNNYDYNSNKYIDITEQRFTNGIIALSSVGKEAKVYTLTGHGERDITTKMALFKMYLELENYRVEDLDLLVKTRVPEDCTSLIIASPTKDFSELETNAIKEYVGKGGNILWLNNPLSTEKETPNIENLLDIYGVKLRQDGIVFEQDQSKMVMGTPDLIIPTIGYSEITQNISKVLLLDSGKLNFADEEKLEELKVTKTTLLTSSDKSFFRTNLGLGFEPISSTNGEKEESSVLGALLQKSVENGETSNLIIIANNFFAEDQGIYTGSVAYSAIEFYNNKDLVLNSVQYLSNIEDSITIRKEIESTMYTATETQDRIIKAIIFIVPVVIIIAGIVIWQLRRRKK